MNTTLDTMDNANPLDGLEDLPASSTDHTREELFADAKRGFVRLRKDFVQKPDKPRNDTVLSTLVRGHKERPLDMLLTVHALQPILKGSPLPLGTWARLLGCTERTARTALGYLEDNGLLQLDGKPSVPEIVLLKENGDGTRWTDAPDRSEGNRGFFTLPFDYWTAGTIDDLNLPGKAMLLMILKETQDPKAKRPTFVMALDKAQEWYGISERTAERGLLQLRKAGLLHEKPRLVPEARHPLGRREEWHRVLTAHYSTAHREELRKAAKSATERSTVSTTNQEGAA